MTASPRLVAASAWSASKHDLADRCAGRGRQALAEQTPFPGARPWPARRNAEQELLDLGRLDPLTASSW